MKGCKQSTSPVGIILWYGGGGGAQLNLAQRTVTHQKLVCLFSNANIITVKMVSPLFFVGGALKQGFMCPRLTLNLIWSWGWPWKFYPPAPKAHMLGLNPVQKNSFDNVDPLKRSKRPPQGSRNGEIWGKCQYVWVVYSSWLTSRLCHRAHYLIEHTNVSGCSSLGFRDRCSDLRV